MARAPRSVRDYMERGFHIPEKYWAEIEAGIPWSELMDCWDPDRTVTYCPYGPAEALDRFEERIRSFFGRTGAFLARSFRRCCRKRGRRH